jgi:hypothetical protein
MLLPFNPYNCVLEWWLDPAARGQPRRPFGGCAGSHRQWGISVRHYGEVAVFVVCKSLHGACGDACGGRAAGVSSWSCHPHVRRDWQSKDGATALFLAAQEGHLDVLRLLLERGSPVRLAKVGSSREHRNK